MKKVYVVFAFVFVFASCNCQKKAVEGDASEKVALSNQNQLPLLEYVANTRGFYQKITIQNQMVTVSNDRNGVEKGETVKISDADMKALTTAFQEIQLDDLAKFKDPTQKRFYDGAAIANLKVTVGEKTYQSVDFDHEFPPSEIEKLVNKIVSFGKK